MGSHTQCTPHNPEGRDQIYKSKYVPLHRRLALQRRKYLLSCKITIDRRHPSHHLKLTMPGGDVTCGGSPHLSCKREQIKMTDYMDRRVTSPKRVTLPTWGPPPPCKQALN